MTPYSRRFLPVAVCAGFSAAILFSATISQAGLVQGFQQTGHLDLEVVGAAGGNPPLGQPANGSLTLNNVIGGQVVRATVYSTSFGNGGAGLDLSFAGMSPVPPIGAPFASDSFGLPGTGYAYQWDVTNIVNLFGQNTYNYSIGTNGSGNQIAGIALAVVYNDFSGPTRQITFVEGMQSVAEGGTAETESFTLMNIQPGPTQISLFTVFDDNAGTGEVINYNNNQIGTNIDQNLGLNASLLQMNTTSTSGNNQLDLVSSNGPGPLGVDNFGWMLSIASVTLVPEPTSCALALWAIGMLGVRGRTWNRQRFESP